MKYKYLLTIIFLFTGCTSLLHNSDPVKISDVRSPPIGLSTIHKKVSRNNVISSIEASRGAGNLRVIPLVTSAAQAPATPEYRLFNIRKGTIAETIGLQNADILIAVHGYVIREVKQFYAYLEALRNERVSSIEIRREGKPFVIELEIG